VIPGDLFTNYRKLVTRVDEFSSRLLLAYRDQLVCRQGCIACCQQDLHLLPVEYYFLLEGFRQLPAAAQELLKIRVKREAPSDGKSCLLLHEDGCLLYSHRPIICRTHGLPLLITTEGQERRDCCPKNFIGHPLEQLPRLDLLHLERLNTLLILVNHLFSSQTRLRPEKRLPVSRLLISSQHRAPEERGFS
jgi:hypothetical protein